MNSDLARLLMMDLQVRVEFVAHCCSATDFYFKTLVIFLRHVFVNQT